MLMLYPSKLFIVEVEKAINTHKKMLDCLQQ